MAEYAWGLHKQRLIQHPRVFSCFVLVLVWFAVCWAPAPCRAQESNSNSPGPDAQDSSVQESSQSEETSSMSATDARFAKKFWNYLLTNNYKHWSPPPGKSSDFFQSESKSFPSSTSMEAHSRWSKIYMNRVGTRQLQNLATGTVMILENYRADKSLMSISVMYRSPGFNPEAGNWFWIQYAPDGTVLHTHQGVPTKPVAIAKTFTASRKTVPLVGRAASCIQCHQSAKSDLAFFNDALNDHSRVADRNALKDSGINE